MQRFYSLKELEKEKYRLHLEKELAAYKLEYFVNNVRSNWSFDNIVQRSISLWVESLIGRLIGKISNR